MHSDVLSCITHANSRLAIAKKGTVPGNEKFVKDLLDAYSRIVMHKSLFHQLIHQSAVVYSEYYGGFMQPMQVALAKKRVKGDPLSHIFKIMTSISWNCIMLVNVIDLLCLSSH